MRDKTDTKHKRSNTRLTQTEKNPILLLGDPDDSKDELVAFGLRAA